MGDFKISESICPKCKKRIRAWTVQQLVKNQEKHKMTCPGKPPGK